MAFGRPEMVLVNVGPSCIFSSQRCAAGRLDATNKAIVAARIHVVQRCVFAIMDGYFRIVSVCFAVARPDVIRGRPTRASGLKSLQPIQPTAARVWVV